ncbi:MAG TPA: sulfate adenylyltransferase subunit CysN [Stellaceae bacterium]|nr:sulfate adenylyltransferase subunit CysN [Stellaceae bacterium]
MPREGEMQPRRTVLRLLTCGSVDDGKSTLIGRLLYDSRLLLDDQIAALERDSRRFGTTGGDIDFALLVDGLEDERRQGITIDVAYRYFSTARRAFVVADAPGHAQYTRNMATAASTAELALLLVDARKGVIEQTRRHAYICALFGIRHAVLAVNKIDLVDYAEDVFRRIAEEFCRFAEALSFAAVQAIPLSARFGDNVTARSARTPWYAGPTLIEHLEAVEPIVGAAKAPFRFPVQWVNRAHADFRGYAGTVAGGSIAVGEPIVVAGSGACARVRQIITFDGPLPRAERGDAVTLVLDEEIDVGRGDVLCPPTERPAVADQFAAHVVWMGEEPLLAGRSYLLKLATREAPATISAIKHRVDVATLQHLAARSLRLNEIGFCNIAADAPLAFDPYDACRETGGFILIDRTSNDTVAAGMIAHPLRRATNVHRQPLTVGRAERAAQKQQRPAVVWFTGLSGAGKSTIADLVEQKLHALGYHTMLLDGDNVRHGLNRDLGFTDADRVENIRRIGEVAKLMTEAGLIVLCSFISPFRSERRLVRELLPAGEFFEVFVDTPLAECERRDPKGLYRKARARLIPNFTGVNAPYEPPENPELHLRTAGTAADAMAEAVMTALRRAHLIEE